MDGRAQNRTAPPGHVDLEDLAALIDERLPAGDCSRVRTHLAECEECYEIFTDVVRFQEEQEQDAGDREVGPPSPFDKTRNTPRSWLTAAAAAALVLVGGWFGYQQMTPPSFSVGPLTGSFVREVSLSSLWQEVRFRGGSASLRLSRPRAATEPWAESASGSLGNEQEEDQQAVSVGLGIQIVDLQIALAQSSGPDVDDIRGTLRVLAGKLTFADSDQINRALAQEEAGAHRAAALPELEEVLRTNADPIHFDLGRWAEAARLAAVAREEEFFNNRSNRRALSWLARQDDLDIETRGALKQLREPWEERQFEQIASGLGELISRYYRQQDEASSTLPERFNPHPAPETSRSTP